MYILHKNQNYSATEKNFSEAQNTTFTIFNFIQHFIGDCYIKCEYSAIQLRHTYVQLISVFGKKH